MEMRAISMADVDLVPEIAWALTQYRKAHRRGELAKNSVRRQDYQRWSVIWQRLGPGDSLIDVGVGVGQLVNAAGHFNRFPQVTGLDYYWQTRLQRLSDTVRFELCDLTAPEAAAYRADVVTCLECIEHIPDPGFEAAVANLQAMYRRKLIVSVPFCEAEPLYKGHHQRFTAARLRELFPGAALTVLLLERQAHWAMVEITR